MKKIALVIAVLAAAVVVQAQTAKETKQMLEWKAYLTDASQSYMKTAKDKCGFDIPVTMEPKFAAPFMTANANAASYCDTPRSALSSLCDDPTYKAAIVKKVKKISCKLGKPDEKSLKFNGTEVIFTVGVSASNLDEAAKKFFEDKL